MSSFISLNAYQVAPILLRRMFNPLSLRDRQELQTLMLE